MPSADGRGEQRRPQSEAFSSCRISSVETPMRIDPNASSPQRHRLAHFERLAVAASRSRAAGRAGRGIDQRREIVLRAAARLPDHASQVAATTTMPLVSTIARVGDVLAVDAGLEDRAQAGIGRAAPRTGSPAAGDDLARRDGGSRWPAAGRATWLSCSTTSASRVDVQRAQRHHRQPDDGGDAGDLLDPDAEAHRCSTPYRR